MMSATQKRVLLQQVSLDSRRFLMQGFAIDAEFGHEIPWLRGLEETLYTVDPNVFVSRLQELTRQDDPFSAYQFVGEGDGAVYLGGILCFPSHPEQFEDGRNVAIAEALEAAGDRFISCLQIRPQHRGNGVGDTMMRQALEAIHVTHGTVWGVVSDPRLVPWHMSTGAELLSPVDNHDDLWIMRWQEANV